MKIIQDSAIYLAGDLLSRSIPFLLLPFLTRMLGVEGFGNLSYYQVVIALGLIFIGFSQDGALTRYYYRYGRFGIGSLILASVLQSLIVFILITTVIIIIDVDNLMIYSVMAAFTQSLLALFLSLQQCQRRPGWYILIQLVNSVFSAGITVVLFKIVQPDVLNRIIAMAVANGISLFVAVVLVYIIQENRFRLSFSFFKSLFTYNISFGFPLLLHQLSFFAKGQADRFLIYKMFSPAILGVYSVGYQLASILAILLMALNKATVPYYYESLKKGVLNQKKILKYTHMSILITPVPFLFYMLMPQSVYLLLLGPGFDDAKYYALLFSVAISLTIPYLLLVNYFFFHGMNKSISACTISSSLLYIILVYILAQIDIKYVPCAMIISNIVMIGLLYTKLARINLR
jgi:O-antigen/teichoic acid export membrane protein